MHIIVWYDKWTPGDTGTLIHIWYFDVDSDDVVHRTLDTNGDSLSGGVVVFAGASTGTTAIGSRLTATKAVGDNLYVFFDIDGGTETGFYRSTDGGASWTSRASPFEATADVYALFPANAADTNDVWMLFDDVSVNAVTLKTYDDSANTWSESATMTTLAEPTQLNSKEAFSGAIRHSDGHLIAVLWNATDTAGADLECWDCTGTATFVQKTNVVNNSTDDQGHCVICIDQNNGDLYVAYGGLSDGSQTFGTSIGIYYKKSTDDGATWGSETTLAESLGDYKALMVDLGGTSTRFEPAWVDEDNNDLKTNFVNSIAITTPAAFQHYGRPHGELGQRQMAQLLAT